MAAVWGEGEEGGIGSAGGAADNANLSQYSGGGIHFIDVDSHASGRVTADIYEDFRGGCLSQCDGAWNGSGGAEEIATGQRRELHITLHFLATYRFGGRESI